MQYVLVESEKKKEIEYQEKLLKVQESIMQSLQTYVNVR